MSRDAVSIRTGTPSRSDTPIRGWEETTQSFPDIQPFGD